MVVYYKPVEMSKEELKDAVREHNHKPCRRALRERYNYSARQLTALSKGEFEERWG